MPKYAKYLKSLLTNKSRLEAACMVTMNERCSAILLNELTSKEKDSTSIQRIDPVNTPYSEKKPKLEKISDEEKSSLCSNEKLKEQKTWHISHIKIEESAYGDFVNYIVGKYFKDANEYVRRCDACQRSGNISSRNEMPQSNIQTEVTNRAIKRILERSAGYNPKDWSNKLNDALWAFRTAYKTPTWCTPFRLVYRKTYHLPVEIEHKAHWALKQCNMDLTLASKSRLMKLNELAKLRDGAYENTRIYKEWTKKWHDSRLHGDKDFKVGDKVLLYISRLKMYPGKLKSKWSGPNMVKTVYPHGAIEITNSDGFSFKVNGQRLKKYYGGDIDKEDDEVIELENDATRS
ncbi:reverse transcriptase domain-containing protein [Tanacetum coccineum]